MTDAPILFQWNAERETMDPLARFVRRCNETFVDREIYRMTVAEERSIASHNHYFVTLTDMWLSLPEGTAERFPTMEHMRKYALIKSGYADQRQIVCASKAEALRMAAFIAPMDDYAIVTATEAVVTVWTAQSQSRKAMGGKVFQESKEKVFDVVRNLLEPEREAA